MASSKAIDAATIVTDDDRWDRVSYTDYTRFGLDGLKILVRRIARLSDDDVAAGVQALENETEVTNPKADKKIYPGAWRIVKMTAGKLRTTEDAAGITQVLVQGEFSEERYLSSANCAEEVWTTPYWMVEERPVLPENSPRYQTSLQVSYDRETGTYTGVLIERYSLYQDTNPEWGTDEFGYIAGLDAFGTNYERKQDAVVDEDVPDMVEEAGYTKQQDISLRDDCSARVTSSKRAVTPRPAARRSWDEDAFFSDIVVEDISTDDEMPDAPVFEAGTSTSQNAALDEFGKYGKRIAQRTEKHVPEVMRSRRISAFVDQSEELERGAPDPTVFQELQTPGVILDESDELSQLGRYSKRVSERRAIERLEAGRRYSPTFFERVHEVSDENATDDLGDPGDVDPVTGLVMHDDRLNEFNVYSRSRRVVEPIAREQARVTAERDLFGTRFMAEDRNLLDEPVPDADALDLGERVVSSRTDAGRFDVNRSREAEAFVEDAQRSRRITAFSKVDTARRVGDPNDEVFPDIQTPGFVTEFDVTKSRLGKFAITRRDEELLAREAAQVNVDADYYGTTRTVEDVNMADALEEPEFDPAEGAVRVSNTLNAGQLYDRRRSTRNIPERPTARRMSRVDWFGARSVEVDRNMQDAPDLPETFVAGDPLESVTDEVNGDGRHDVTRETDTATERVLDEKVVEVSEGLTTFLERGFNVLEEAVPEPSWMQGEVVQVSEDVLENGRRRYRKQRTASEEIELEPLIVRDPTGTTAFEDGYFIRDPQAWVDAKAILYPNAKLVPNRARMGDGTYHMSLTARTLDTNNPDPSVNTTPQTKPQKKHILHSDGERYRTLTYNMTTQYFRGWSAARSAASGQYKPDFAQIGGGWIRGTWISDLNYSAWQNIVAGTTIA